MRGNFQVRFLEGWAPAMASGYSTTWVWFDFTGLSQTLAIERTENLPSVGVAVTDFSSYQIGIS